MSKIAEIKAFDRYPKDRKGCLYDMARNEYIQGYNQAMQDFLEKAEKILTERMYLSNYKTKQFKNYMQNESEK